LSSTASHRLTYFNRQVLENYRRHSVEGLAWPFLANWLLGDVSNLVGCILTHQLPFQTYLATYFCFIDLTLVGQYLYYTSNMKSKAFPARSRTTSSATLPRRLSIDRPPTHYRALSNVAANVAAAAALAAQQEEQSRWRASQHYRAEQRVSRLAASAEAEDEDEVDGDALARLADSFHSEGGRGTQKVSWSTSQERRTRGGSLGRSRSRPVISPISRINPSLPIPTSPTLLPQDHDYTDRGRTVSREIPLIDDAQNEWAAESSAQRRSSRASRKSAGMVFLSMWALFSIGTLAGARRGKRDVRVGRLLLRDDLTLSKSVYAPPLDATGRDPLDMTFDGRPKPNDKPVSFGQLQFLDDIPLPDPHEEDGPSTEYIIGRISAWACTTLYLTSRLPQIWKNYVRKSIEGLSISLFVFAFMGNVLYVASILTSPKLGDPEPQASAFLRESIPYLLGSGGTLMFDVTIVVQSFLYRPETNLRGRRLSRSLSEEEGLLSAGATGAEDPLTPSRRRLPTGGEGVE